MYEFLCLKIRVIRERKEGREGRILPYPFLVTEELDVICLLLLFFSLFHSSLNKSQITIPDTKVF